ncbi:MAG: ATP-binding protein [Planctomycetes bacterium]|nr:ATP-binding protein [Planctomycetota bacterium]
MSRLLGRPRHEREVMHRLRSAPVVAILGARQTGKSTLARSIAEQQARAATMLDLEDPADVARLSDPGLFLRGLRGLVVLDEIQRRPELFPILRVLADRPRRPARFLVLGSASPELLRQGSESLAGRIAFHELAGFDLEEVGASAWRRLWLRGGFPRSFRARSDKESMAWRRDFVSTFLERDLPQLGVTTPAPTLRRFWSMLAHWHGQIWNASEFARAFGVSVPTIGRYLDQLEGTLVVRRLPAWHENLSKRQVKAPKVYVHDSGLLHALLGLATERDLLGHPKVGASWEGFALEQVVRRLGAGRDECFFWATHGGAELDLLVVRGRTRLGFEMKLGETPGVTASMRSALADLRLQRLDVVHSGEHSFELAPKVRALALPRLLDDLAVLR